MLDKCSQVMLDKLRKHKDNICSEELVKKHYLQIEYSNVSNYFSSEIKKH